MPYWEVLSIKLAEGVHNIELSVSRSGKMPFTLMPSRRESFSQISVSPIMLKEGLLSPKIVTVT